MLKREGPYLVVTNRSPTTYDIADPAKPDEVLGTYHNSALRAYELPVARDSGIVSPLRRCGRPKKFCADSSPRRRASLRKITDTYSRSSGVNGSDVVIGFNITSLNRKRGNIKNQLTKLNNALTEGQNKMDIPELQAQLDIVLNIEHKFEELKDDNYKIAKKEDFQKVGTSLFEVDDDIQKLEVSLKTSIHLKIREGLKPLTPACFLQGFPSSDTTDLDEIDSKSLNRRLHFIQKLRHDLRTRFCNEYLAMLMHKGRHTRDESLNVEDIILLQNDGKRLHWPLGIVIEVLPGADGHSRIARAKTAQGEKLRPFQRLYSLEIRSFEKLPFLAQQKDIDTNTQLPATPVVSDQDSSEDDDYITKVAPDVITKAGRRIKIPNRLNL
ncbi:hypothetical protein HNY73_002777 [Argiope bruennichi]|uniref:DUF5641 domain-containing protein n=1 Tax=Argiope bruennichi TaxID=94029 RepID=A0A8T0FX87_ARGBR|nr:hypothetical protein HNY73_002777 [Argiope bruennichi]